MYIAHSFEGKLFTIVSCSTVSQEIKDALTDVPNVDELLDEKVLLSLDLLVPMELLLGNH